MATKTVSDYASPNSNVRREWCSAVGATTAGTYAPYQQLQKFRLKSVTGAVLVAGTHDSTNSIVIRKGTTSIGAMNPGTATALSTFSSGALDVTFERGEVLNLLKGADATGQSVVTYELEVLPDAVWTV